MFNTILRYSIILFGFAGLTGCEILEFDTDKHISSSLLDYLYPEGEHEQKSKQGELQKSIPHLKLPVRIGIAFVPSTNYTNILLTPAQQIELLKKAETRFSKHQFIEHIEMIPANYLQLQGGFTNLEQIAKLYNLDLMALVSYDQVQKSYAKDMSLLYLTVVGAYIFKGDDNHTQSFVDAAVFDVESKTLLFRAPGTHRVRINSTMNHKKLVQDAMSQQSFELAMQNMLFNLDAELNAFIERVGSEKIAEISYKKSYSGGGSIDLILLFFIVLFLLKKLELTKKIKE